jgi:hypothetical protein
MGSSSTSSTNTHGDVATLALRDGCESTLGQDPVRALVEQHLRNGPPAWDPYRITR